MVLGVKVHIFTPSAFIQVPNSLVEPEVDGQFQVKIANTTNRKIIVRAGELLGHLHKAEEVLKTATDFTEQELEAFLIRAATLTTLIPKLNTHYEAVTTTHVQPTKDSDKASSLEQEVEPADNEHLGWGPKTADPGPD